MTNSAASDEFTVDLSQLSVTTPAFTYRVHADDETALASQCPLVIKPTWKPQGDKLGLFLEYRLNPDSGLARPVTLSNVVLVATYEGARASGVQTKPSGTHLKEKHLVYWRLGDVTLDETWQKVICRVIGEQNAEPMPGHIEARWEYVPAGVKGQAGGAAGCGISVSRVVESKGKEKAVDADEEDPFADDKGGQLSPLSAKFRDPRKWVDVPLVTRLTGGKYEGR